MRKKLVTLVATLAMMLAMAAPAMATPVQLNAGSAAAQNNNATFQLNAAEQSNAQLAVFGSNYSNQELKQGNFNATSQNANAFAGNIYGF